MVVTDELREVCSWIAARSTVVRLVEERLQDYAVGLGVADGGALTSVVPTTTRPPGAPQAAREDAAAYWFTLDAVNFGSGWFPTLRKRSQSTGYRTIAAGIRRRFDQAGRWTVPELLALSNAELGQWLDQDPEHELIGLMVRSLHDLGDNVQRLYGRSFAAVVDAANGSAITLVEQLAQWRCFADFSLYDGRRVPFLKRAQIAAADLHRNGVAEFHDLNRLTMFADNLVPHVLRLDGILWFDPELVARIERGELIEHGSPEEVEIRACAVHAVELLAAAVNEALPERPTTAAEIDETLWNRGQAKQYKAVPRHRSRSTAY
jgi:hypothetical protein